MTLLYLRITLDSTPPYSKGCEPYGEIHLPREAQQEDAQKAGQPETRDLGFLPHDQEGRKQKTLQPQEKRSCLER